MLRIELENESINQTIKKASDIVRKGGIIAYPTDTIYGLGCDPFNEEAVEKIYRIKQRGTSIPLIILLDAVEKVDNWIDKASAKMQSIFSLWPERLSVIIEVKNDTPHHLTRKGNTLAFRVPKNDFCLKLVSACGGALTSTSVNRSNNPELNDPDSIEKEFTDDIDLLISTKTVDRQSSTIVKVEGESVIKIREGSYKFPEGK